jgi:hypothetical protein
MVMIASGLDGSQGSAITHAWHLKVNKWNGIKM